MKKKILLTLILLLSTSAITFADTFSRPFETVDEARARHSADNYNTYKNNNYRAPLGGYTSKLGDPQPKGTLQPGYVNNGLNSNYVNSNKSNNNFGW
jgi:hypothetical protein